MPEQIDHKPDVPPTARPETGAQVIGRPELQTLFIDKFVFSKRVDNNILFTGIQSIFQGVEVEQLRFIVSLNHAQKVVEKLAQLIDFYPTKPLVPPPAEKTALPEAATVKTENKAAPVPEEKAVLHKAGNIEKNTEVSKSPEKLAVQKIVVKKQPRRPPQNKSPSKK